MNYYAMHLNNEYQPHIIKTLTRYSVIALVIILCIGVRFYCIPQTNLSKQELISYNIASQPSIHKLITNITNQTQDSLLFFLTAHIYLKLHAHTKYYLRFISVLFSLFSLLLFYLTTRLFLSQLHAVIVIILTYFSAYHWYYTYQFTYHSMLLFFITLNTYAFFWLIRHNCSQMGKWLFIISGILALHTHLFALFCFISQFCVLSCIPQKERRISKKALGINIAWIVCFSPLMIYFLAHHIFIPIIGQMHISSPIIYTMPNIFLRFLFGVWGIGTLEHSLLYWIMYTGFISISLKGFLHFKMVKQTLRIKRDNNYILCGCAILLFVQIFLPFILSYYTPIIDDGKGPLICVLYPFFTLLSAGILSFRHIGIRIILVIIFIGANIHSLIY